jgi:predicted anti-sigma-YlaC factor YlaD
VEAVARLFGCEFVGERLSAYLDDDLGRVTRRLVKRHLSRCEMCRSALRTLSRVIEQLRALERAEQPPGRPQVDAIVERIRGEALEGPP